MRGLGIAAAFAALLVLPACSAPNAGPSGQLASLLDFAAYPGATQVQAWTHNGGGPIPLPGSAGGREYRTNDGPAAIHAHYLNLAREKGWTLSPETPPDVPGAPIVQIGQLARGKYSVSILASTSSSGPYSVPYGGGPIPAPSPPPPGGTSTPGPNELPTPSPSPTAAPTTPPGPWFVRTEAWIAQ